VTAFFLNLIKSVKKLARVFVVGWTTLGHYSSLSAVRYFSGCAKVKVAPLHTCKAARHQVRLLMAEAAVARQGSA